MWGPGSGLGEDRWGQLRESLHPPCPRGPLLPSPTPDKSTFYFPEEDPRAAARKVCSAACPSSRDAARAAGAGAAPEHQRGPRLCPETDSGSGSTGGAAGGLSPEPERPTPHTGTTTNI